MAGKVTFLAIDKWRDYLEYTIGRKLRDFFASNKGASIPPVTFYTPQQARAARLPETGWYDYSERRIGVVINPERNPKREWVWATLAVVHECLHWLFNHSPIMVGIEKPLERHIMNIFRDASNEQRGLLEFAWSRHIIRRGRRVILDEYLAERAGWPGGNCSPVYEAANLTLVAHTLLAARGLRLLRHLYGGKATPMAVWNVLEPVIGSPPASIANDWPRAFELAVRAWKERNEFDRADLVREFIALFPKPDAIEQPPESPVDIGGHIGEERPASGDPPGAASIPDQQSSRKSSENKPSREGESSKAGGNGDQQIEGQPDSSSDEDNSQRGTSGKSDKADESGSNSADSDESGTSGHTDSEPDLSDKPESGDGTGESRDSGESGDSSSQSEKAGSEKANDSSDSGSDSKSSGRGSTSSGSTNSAADERDTESSYGEQDADSVPLSLDPDDPDDANQSDGTSEDGADAQDNPRAVAADLKDLNREAETWVPGVAPDENGDRIYPADPRNLVDRARSYAAELAAQLRISERPELRGRSKRGRVLARVVARQPDAKDPFLQKQGVIKRFGPGAFVAVLVDSSGSMLSGSKWPSAQLAAMSAHLACEQASVPHVILMSRTLKQLAGIGLASTRSKVLVAGARPATGGDHYTLTLPKALQRIAERSEAIKIVIVITDGMPHNLHLLKQQVEQVRGQGMVVVGVGLDLNSVEASGMKFIFGNEDVVIVRSGDGGKNCFAATLGRIITAAVTRGKRIVHPNRPI
jgi:hypothetical protein